MHLALQALHNGECEGALVGGCQLNAKQVIVIFALQMYLQLELASSIGVFIQRAECCRQMARADHLMQMRMGNALSASTTDELTFRLVGLQKERALL